LKNRLFIYAIRRSDDEKNICNSSDRNASAFS